MEEILTSKLPGVKHYVPEGTYLYWLDFNMPGASGSQVREQLINGAKVGLNDGKTFSRMHDGYWRFNFAVPRSMLLEGLERIVRTFS